MPVKHDHFNKNKRNKMLKLICNNHIFINKEFIKIFKFVKDFVHNFYTIA